MKHFVQAALRLMRWVSKHRVGVTTLALVIIVVSIPLHSFATTAADILANPFESAFNLIIGIMLAISNLCVELTGKLIVLLLGAIIIPILSYNNFGDSAVVDIGWPLVRDVVNMFVIVVLLVVAVQTIVGYGQSKWEQQLPRLFLAIVLVNFSRLICLVMVDVSQIVMFTFVNALRDIAAGNFMSLFQLNEFVSVNTDFMAMMSASQNSTGVSTIDGASMTNLLMTSYATLALLGMVLGTLAILVVVYVYRIVLIWVLMILSPIAFFMKGLEGIVSEGKSKYDEWMKMFVGAVTLGPILTFFLWLGLAAASAGPIATSEGMNFEGTKDVPTLLAGAFATDKFLSVIIGMILIMAGFKVASGAASAMGNIAGKLVTEDAGKKMFKGALTLPASTAYRGARGVGKGAMYVGGKAGGAAMWAGKRAGAEVGRQFAGSELGKSFTKEGTGVLAGIGKTFVRQGGFMGTKVGGAFIGASDRFRAGMESPNAIGREKAKEQTAGESEQAAAAHLSAAFNPDGSIKKGVGGTADMRANEQRIIRAMTDKKFRKTLKDQMSPAEYATFMQNAMAHVDKNKDDVLDDNQSKEFDKTRNGNLSAWIEAKKAQALADHKPPLTDADIQKELNEIISDDDFRVGQLSEGDMKNDAILKALEAKSVRSWTDADGTEHHESMLSQVRAGRGVDAAVQNAAKRPTAPPPPAPPPPPGADVILNTGAVDQIRDAIRSGIIDVNAIDASHVSSATQAEEIARAIVASNKDVGSVTDPAIRTAITDALGRASGRTDISRNERASINQARVAAGVDVNQVFNISNTGGVSTDMAKQIRDAMANNPSTISRFDAQLTQATNSGATDVSQAITDAISRVNFTDLARQFNSAQNDTQRNEISSVMDRYEQALRAEAGRSTNTTARDNELLKHQRAIDLARLQM